MDHLKEETTKCRQKCNTREGERKNEEWMEGMKEGEKKGGEKVVKIYDCAVPVNIHTPP